jgi:alkylhydroperoxidase family enzyme
LTEEVVERITDDWPESDLSPRQKAVLAYTDAFLNDPAKLGPPARVELERHLSPEEVVELTAGIALFMGFSKIAIALGQAPAAMPTLVVPTPE